MGLSFTEKNGKWQGESSISGGKLFNKRVSKDEVKKHLIEKKIWDFLESMIKIEMEFPIGWTVNDRRIPYDKNKESFNQWWMKAAEGSNEDFFKETFEKSITIIKKYNLQEYFEPFLNKEEV